MNNIYLVGFMGTGKTSVGKFLAQKKKMSFLDLDELIELKQKRTIRDIFAKEGESYFRMLEKRTLKEVSEENNFVVACGGGIVIDPENIKIMKATGRIFCLNASSNIILKRTSDSSARPLLNVENPKEKIELLMKMRAPFYAKADFCIDTTKLSIKEVVEQITKTNTASAKTKKNKVRSLFLTILPVLFFANCFAAELTLEDPLEFESEDAIQQQQYDIDNNNISEADYYFNEGLEHKKNGRFDAALISYTKAIDLNNHHAKAFNNRGNVYMMKNELSLALLDFNSAIELDPSYAKAYANRGLVYARQSKLDEAIKDFSKAVELNPSLAESYNNRGLCFFYKEQFDYAIIDFSKAIGLDQEYQDAYYNRGLAFLGAGDSNKAIADFTKVLKTDPNFAEAYNNRGLAYSYLGVIDEAIADYTRAIEINFGYADAYKNRGVDYYFMRQYTKAADDIKKARELGAVVDEEFLKDLAKAIKGKNWLFSFWKK